MIPPQTRTMTLAEFTEAYSREPFELVEGEVITIMSPQITRSGRFGFALARLFADFVDEHSLGEIFIEVPFVLIFDETNWVLGSRTPDIMFYSAERMAEITKDADWEDKPIIGAPDFIVEVVSPTDKYVDVMKKVTDYLRDGVRLVWLVEPKRKQVTVCAPNNLQTVYNKPEDVLVLDGIIKDFQVTIDVLFK